MGPKILVVDDSRMIRHQVSAALMEAGFEVIEATDGLDALSKLDAASHGVSLVLCDLNMPRMNGLEFLEGAIQMMRGAVPPVVVLTTETDPKQLQRAKDLGAKGWIIKPFSTELLVATAVKLSQGA